MQVEATSQKYTKAEVNFQSPAKGMRHCKACEHFEVQRKNGCEIVAGFIKPRDWCRLWEKRD